METATFGIMVERTEVEILLFFGGALMLMWLLAITLLKHCKYTHPSTLK